MSNNEMVIQSSNASFRLQQYDQQNSSRRSFIVISSNDCFELCLLASTKAKLNHKEELLSSRAKGPRTHLAGDDEEAGSKSRANLNDNFSPRIRLGVSLLLN